MTKKMTIPCDFLYFAFWELSLLPHAQALESWIFHPRHGNVFGCHNIFQPPPSGANEQEGMEKIPNQILDDHQQDGPARPSPAGGKEGLAPTCSCSSASDGLERTSKGESEMPKARPSPIRNIFQKSLRRCCMLTTDPQMFQLPLALCPKIISNL